MKNSYQNIQYLVGNFVKDNTICPSNCLGMKANVKEFITDLVDNIVNDNYSEDSYIQDIISETANSNTSIYYADLLEHIPFIVGEFEDVVNEYNDISFDFYATAQRAEQRFYENIYYNNEKLINCLVLEVMLGYGYSYLDMFTNLEVPENLATVKDLKEFTNFVKTTSPAYIKVLPKQ